MLSDHGDDARRPAAGPLLVERLTRLAVEMPDAPAYTFVDYSADPGGERRTLTWAQLDARSGAVAARLRRVATRGDRAAVLAPSGLGYVLAWLGALRAGLVAVPLFQPDLPGHAERLAGIFDDCAAPYVLTTTRARASVEHFLNEHRLNEHRLNEHRLNEHRLNGHRPSGLAGRACPDIVTVDDVPAATWAPERVRGDDIAYLQYTSGSTRSPAGVVITHDNLTANVSQISDALALTPRRSVTVSWLPLFHDMGLVTSAAMPLLNGNHTVFMDPAAFLMRPARWMRLLAEYDDVFAGGPNFAYDYCAARVPDDDKRGLDLSRVGVLFNGAEPIRPETIERFTAAFAGCGLRPEALSPAYGLAEATVCVSVSPRTARPRTVIVDRDRLAVGEACACPPDAARATRIVSCGTPAGQLVVIADPGTHRWQPAGVVGEIWVRGPNVARSYWGAPQRSAETFGAVLTDHPQDVPAGPWLRTGDLGVILDGELYVTGRLKDLIIADGRNHYPQDIEATAQAAHGAIREGHVAAFAVPGTETERLVIVAERSRRVLPQDGEPAAVASAVRGAVFRSHSLRLHDFVFVEPGGVPRTSSGKVARAACRQRYLDDVLPVARHVVGSVTSTV